MKHAQIRISLVEWLQEHKDQTAIQTVAELLGWLIERGYSSFETKMTSLLKEFTDVFVDQSVLKNVTSKLNDRLIDDLPAVFVTCLKKDDAFLFIDTETDSVEALTEDTAETPSIFDVEIDIFAPDKESLESNKRLIVDEVIECFGLTESRETLLATDASIQPFAETIRETLTIYQPLDENLFQLLRDEKERMILRELKRRGAVLERDLHELSLDGIEPDRIKRTLDYLSGEKYLLVERKYAIVCNETQEIIFTLP